MLTNVGETQLTNWPISADRTKLPRKIYKHENDDANKLWNWKLLSAKIMCDSNRK